MNGRYTLMSKFRHRVLIILLLILAVILVFAYATGLLEAIVEEYLFANQVPALRDKVMKSMLKKESLLVRKKTIPRVIDKIMGFIYTFIEGVAA